MTDEATVADPTKAELYERATALEIDGRGAMNKAELAAAVAAAESAASDVADEVLEEDTAAELEAQAEQDLDEDDPPIADEGVGAVEAEESQEGAPSAAAVAGEAANQVADEVLEEGTFEVNDRVPEEGDEVEFIAGATALPATVDKVYNRHLVDLLVVQGSVERLRRAVAYDADRASGTWSWPEGE